MKPSRRTIVLVAHNIRSTHNIGSLLRTAEGLGVKEAYLTGYTPYPEAQSDSRLPHQRRKQTTQIHKTALGAEFFVKWRHEPDIEKCIELLESGGYSLVALEQTPTSISLSEYSPPPRVALFVGNELTGLEAGVLRKIKNRVQIPMSGRKESFNVAVAAAIALYHLRYMDKNSAKV